MSAVINLDHALLEAATRLGGSSAARDGVVYFFANVLPFAMVGVGLWLLRTGGTVTELRRNREVGLAAVVAVVLAVAIRALIANSLARPRPFAALPHIHHLAFGALPGLSFSGRAYSFPSGHAAMLFAFTGTVFFMRRHNRLALALLIISTLVIIARVVGGFHYPTDVIGGALLGLTVARLVAWQGDWIERQLR